MHIVARAALAAVVAAGTHSCSVTVVDCTASHGKVRFVAGDTQVSFVVRCNIAPRSLRVVGRLEARVGGKWRNLGGPDVITEPPRPIGHPRTYRKTLPCVVHARERLYLWGHAVSDTGQPDTDSGYFPTKAGIATELCGL
jgi:hypothetical protein